MSWTSDLQVELWWQLQWGNHLFCFHTNIITDFDHWRQFWSLSLCPVMGRTEFSTPPWLLDCMISWPKVTSEEDSCLSVAMPISPFEFFREKQQWRLRKGYKAIVTSQWSWTSSWDAFFPCILGHMLNLKMAKELYEIFETGRLQTYLVDLPETHGFYLFWECFLLGCITRTIISNISQIFNLLPMEVLTGYSNLKLIAPSESIQWFPS